MGWISAAGVIQHFHRNLLRHERNNLEGLPLDAEVRRDLPFPCRPSAGRGERKPWAVWQVYIDNFDLLEIGPLMDTMPPDHLGHLPRDLHRALELYRSTGVPTSDEKQVVREAKTTSLGVAVNGDVGCFSPPPLFVQRLLHLTLTTLSRPR
eukprot:9075731-Karenia_brevis.AAC.1